MKKRILIFGAFLLIAVGLYSCEELLGNCETCRYNVYDVNGSLLYSELEAEYCGADLIAKKAAADVVTLEGTANETTTKFECD